MDGWMDSPTCFLFVSIHTSSIIFSPIIFWWLIVTEKRCFTGRRKQIICCETPQTLSVVWLGLYILTKVQIKQRWAIPALLSCILSVRPWWSEVWATWGVPAAANNKHRGGKWDDDGKNACSVLIKAPLPGWCVELRHRGGNGVESINLWGFLPGSKVI